MIIEMKICEFEIDGWIMIGEDNDKFACLCLISIDVEIRRIVWLLLLLLFLCWFELFIMSRLPIG